MDFSALVLRAPIIDADEAATLKSALTPDLEYILTSSGVPTQLIIKIASLGFVDVRTFASWEESSAQIRRLVDSDLTLDIDSPAARSAVSRVVVAWEVARARVTARIRDEADRRVGGRFRELPKSEYLQAVRNFTVHHEELRDKDVPSSAYLEAKIEQIEDGEWVVETLKEVTNREETNKAPETQFKLQQDGTYKAVKQKVESSSPTNTEELRRKFRLMGRVWEMVRLKFPHLAALRNYKPYAFEEFLEWLLGEQVFERVIKDPISGTELRCSWDVLLTYEFQIRKRMCKRMNDTNDSLVEALKHARKDSELRDQHFIVPFSLSVSRNAAPKRPAEGPALDGGVFSKKAKQRLNQKLRQKMLLQQAKAILTQTQGSPAPRLTVQPPARQQGGGGGSAKGGKAAGKDCKAHPLQWATPEKVRRCFKYQRGECEGEETIYPFKGPCGMSHTCLFCGGHHPLKSCETAPDHLKNKKGKGKGKGKTQWQ